MDILSYLLGRRAGGSGDSGGGGGGDTDDDIVIISIQPTGRLQQDLWACYRINLTKETTVELQPNEVDMLMMDMFNNSDDFGVYGGEVVACDYGYGKYPLVHVGQRNTSEIIITFSSVTCKIQARLARQIGLHSSTVLPQAN